MSADAKAWEDQGWWFGVHDGDCNMKHENLSCVSVLSDVEHCFGSPLYWEIYQYPDGLGLRGYAVPQT